MSWQRLIIRFVGSALVLVALSVACYYWYSEYTGRVFWQQRAGSVSDSLRRSEGLNGRLRKQADDATRYAYQYKAEKDKAVAESDRIQDKLTYAQKLASYYELLVKNKTLAPAAAQKPGLSLSDETVLDAGLKTANRERIASEKSTELERSVATRDALIDALKTDRQNSSQSLSSLRLGITAKAKGGVWPLNVKRKRQLRAIEKQIAIIQTKTDSLIELNK